MIRTIYWILGYPDELLEEADERQKHLKHICCKQIRDSRLMLKKVSFDGVEIIKPKRKTRKRKK